MPSNQESEKGEYSDAFKRAGFMWGIGRNLYDVPQLFVTLREGEYRTENGKLKATSKLKPNDWEWEISEDLKHCVAKDKQGVRVSVDESDVEPPVTPPVPPQSVAAPKVAQSTDHGVCKDCGAANKWSTKKNKAYCGALCWDKPKPAEPMTVVEAAKVTGEVRQDETDLASIPF